MTHRVCEPDVRQREAQLVFAYQALTRASSRTLSNTPVNFVYESPTHAFFVGLDDGSVR